ncbi:phage portal protein [Lichenihabitans sp. PAMC28606]|uniref:phage portal protein n=1 Tax=Lichenihabitans sp. PAMC28606 TaxID=2880932 RepID=UPI001D09C4E3|nr:phage portal protein [Lichenihabitans sp. PAMC28606]UDL95497.1 phage portal protein [Lichenihabitans sp. PAMC28606]
MNALARLTGFAKGALGFGNAQSAPTPRSSTGYMKGEINPFFMSWGPALRDARDDVRLAWAPATARTIDAIHNSGWLSGAIDQVVASTVGKGMRLNAKPDYDALGWTAVEASAWAKTVERQWEAWAGSPLECDAAGRMTIAQMTAAGLRSYFATGEIVATLPWVKRSVSRTRTKVGLIQSHRLAQDTIGTNLFQGVFMDSLGMPIGYRFREQMVPITPYNGLTGIATDVAARDSAGRPMVIHVFDGEAHQVRGLTPLAPALKVMRQYDQLADATLTAAMIQAIFAATLQSEAPTEQVLRALQTDGEQAATPNVNGPSGAGSDPSIMDLFAARDAWYQNTKIDLGNAGKIAHLFPGEQLKFNRSEHPNSTYEAFAKFLLRECARCLGITFEDFTGDYSGASYASINNATSIVWRVVEYRRAHILTPFLQPIFDAWLEEQIDSGTVKFPGGLTAFIAQRSAVTRADWFGPGKPQSDLLKVAKAYETLQSSGVISDAMICSDLGTNVDDVYDARAKEMAKRKELGLPEPNAPPPDPILNDRSDNDSTKGDA